MSQQGSDHPEEPERRWKSSRPKEKHWSLWRKLKVKPSWMLKEPFWFRESRHRTREDAERAILREEATCGGMMRGYYDWEIREE